MEMSTVTENSKDPYDSAAFKLITFWFGDHMSLVRDYLWKGKVPVQGLGKNKKWNSEGNLDIENWTLGEIPDSQSYNEKQIDDLLNQIFTNLK